LGTLQDQCDDYVEGATKALMRARGTCVTDRKSSDGETDGEVHSGAGSDAETGNDTDSSDEAPSRVIQYKTLGVNQVVHWGIGEIGVKDVNMAKAAGGKRSMAVTRRHLHACN
jgi:hypothetical protein